MGNPLGTYEVQEKRWKRRVLLYERTGGKTSGELADIAYRLGKDPVLMREIATIRKSI